MFLMTRKLVLSGIMLAMAAVLSLVKVWQMPLGGSVTLLSMLPICVLSIKYGVKWGLFSAFAYALIQLLMGLGSLMSWGLTVEMWVGSIVFDYLLAFTVLGLAGLFAKKGVGGVLCGVSIALVLRFISHFISGSIFFAIWCPEGWNVAVYSLAYNGAYMLPELIFTVAGAAALFSVPQVRKLLQPEK
jgi:thiamine transporter